VLYQSPYFQKAVPWNTREGLKSYNLDRASCTIHTFKTYLAYLYVRKLTPPTDFASLLALYVLGEDLNDRAFTQAAMDALITYLKAHPYRRPDPECLFQAYDQVSPQSPLRKLIVDVCVWHYDDLREGDLPRMPTKLKDELLLELVNKLSKHNVLLGDLEPWKVRPSQYKVAPDSEQAGVADSSFSTTPSILTTPRAESSVNLRDSPTHNTNQSDSPKRNVANSTKMDIDGKKGEEFDGKEEEKTDGKREEEEPDRRSPPEDRSDTFA
jgi:hypothetical protein